MPITNTGIEPQSLDDIINTVATHWETLHGASINTDSYTPNGQIVELISAAIYEVNQTIEHSYSKRLFSNLQGSELDLAASDQHNAVRQTNEPDSVFIKRILQARTNNTVGQRIETGLNTIPNITYYATVTNNSDLASNTGMPPNSWAVVVEGGDDALIAKEVYKWVAGGTGIVGNVTVEITDNVGRCISVPLVRPNAIGYKLSLKVAKVPHRGCINTTREGVLDWLHQSIPTSSINTVKFSVGVPIDERMLIAALPLESGLQIQEVVFTSLDDEPLNNISVKWFEYIQFDHADITVEFI